MLAKLYHIVMNISCPPNSYNSFTDQQDKISTCLIIIPGPAIILPCRCSWSRWEVITITFDDDLWCDLIDSCYVLHVVLLLIVNSSPYKIA